MSFLVIADRTHSLYAPAGSRNSRPYCGAVVTRRPMTSGETGGGRAERSRTSSKTSSKKSSIPAGVNVKIMRIGSGPELNRDKEQT
jgi:hypothetical protein